MDPVSSVLVTFGVILLFVSWIYLIFISFEHDYGWGLCSIFLPFLSYLYACFAWDKGREVIILAVLGSALVLFGL